ncbi:MAG: sensor histidine kinase [Actinobacteria bacterium]|nr:sensor histidine kinase [Actinomycetota bacterium]
MIARRLPIQSGEPVVWIAGVRLLFAAAALAAVLSFAVPHRTASAIVIGAVGLPWSIAALDATRRRPNFSLNPLVAVVDFAILGGIQVAEPQAYAGVRFVALFFVATHAYFLGELGGLVVGVAAAVALVPAAALLRQIPVSGGMLAFYETLFAVAALSCGLLVGRLRTAESAARLRARELSRRAIEAEAAVRRRLAESIHDGPVQELVSLDLMLASVDQAAARNDAEGARERLADARVLTERNIKALRDEIIGLGPYAFEELTFAAAVEQCAPVWRRRYGMEVELAIAPLDLDDEICGALFGITQEAVANAGRHAGASRIVVALRPVGAEVELVVSDDGRGFEGSPPLAATEPGHIGLASMKERAELIGGRLDIETGDRGTAVTVRVLPRLAAGDGAGPR